MGRIIACLLAGLLISAASATEGAELTVVQAVIAKPVDERGALPVRPIEQLRLPGRAMFYVRATGYQPGRRYTIRAVVNDEAKRVESERIVQIRPDQADWAVWFPIRTTPSQKPGREFYSLYVDGELLAQVPLKIVSGASAPLERLRPWFGIALLSFFGLLAVRVLRRERLVPETGPEASAKAGHDRSLFGLVAVNLLPLALVTFGGWDVGDVLLIYWLENLVVGGYAVLRILLTDDEYCWPLAAFFTLHFGLFCAGHGFFLKAFFPEAFSFTDAVPDDAHGLRMVAYLAEQLLLHGWSAVPAVVFLPLVALAISHGLSFIDNYLGRQQYMRSTAKEEMQRPYKRLAIMHVCIVLGGVLMMQFERGATWMLALLVLLKLAVDVGLHRKFAAPRQA